MKCLLFLTQYFETDGDDMSDHVRLNTIPSAQCHERFRTVATKPIMSGVWQTIFLIASIAVTSTDVFAAEILSNSNNSTEGEARERAVLPPYCIYTQGFRNLGPGGEDQREIDRWYSLLGPTFHHMHHYCRGLVQSNRALLFGFENRNSHLASAVQEFEYVINRSPSDFVMLPEILTKKGEYLLLLGRAPEGTIALLRAMELKSDYWPPYAVLSDYFKKVNNIEMAREWLEKGLAAAPNTKALQQRLTALGSVRSR